MDRVRLELQLLLAPLGQEHVLTFWDQLTAQQRERLAAQVRMLSLKKLDELVRRGSSSENWLELARRAVAPPAIRLRDQGQSSLSEQAQNLGQQALEAGHVGVILVAGGQGTRLGFDQPKGMFSLGPVSGASLFQILLEKVVARSRTANMRIPLYLMTSPVTHTETIEYLGTNENFGLPREDLHVFCQGTMPAVDARTGRLLLAEKDQLALSPDGHGGLLQALAASGCLADMRGVCTRYFIARLTIRWSKCAILTSWAIIYCRIPSCQRRWSPRARRATRWATSCRSTAGCGSSNTAI